MSAPPRPRNGGQGAAGKRREVYLEFFPIGNSVKVVAVDSVTGLEVTIIGPASASRSTLEQIAVRKLNFMLKKSKNR